MNIFATITDDGLDLYSDTLEGAKEHANDLKASDCHAWTLTVPHGLQDAFEDALNDHAIDHMITASTARRILAKTIDGAV